jgi:hypothetical protein
MISHSAPFPFDGLSKSKVWTLNERSKIFIIIMKIIIKESRAIKHMKAYVDAFLPLLSKPLKKRLHKDVTGLPMYFQYIGITGTPIIHELFPTEANISKYSRFYVIPTLENLYGMFGKDLFEEYFRQVHNIDLSDAGDFNKDWNFSLTS